MKSFNKYLQFIKKKYIIYYNNNITILFYKQNIP